MNLSSTSSSIDKKTGASEFNAPILLLTQMVQVSFTVLRALVRTITRCA